RSWRPRWYGPTAPPWPRRPGPTAPTRMPTGRPRPVRPPTGAGPPPARAPGPRGAAPPPDADWAPYDEPAEVQGRASYHLAANLGQEGTRALWFVALQQIEPT